jgi:hypothetical protein
MDPLATETVNFVDRTLPSHADFTAPIALGLSREHPEKIGFAAMLNPEKFAHTARLVQVQPYAPNKIPVLFVTVFKTRQCPGCRWSARSGLIPFCAGITRCVSSVIRAVIPSNTRPYCFGANSTHSTELFLITGRLVLVGHSMGGNHQPTHDHRLRW